MQFDSPLKGSSLFVNDVLGRSPDYGTQGFSVNLPRNRAAAYRVYHEMKTDFADRRTRMLAFKLTVYNINIDMLTHLVVKFETDITGQIEQSYSLQSALPMPNIFYADDWFHFFCFVCWLGMQVFLVLVEVSEFRELGFKTYFDDVWNKFEISHTVVTIVFLERLFHYQAVSLRLPSSLGRGLTATPVDIVAPNGTLQLVAQMYGTVDVEELVDGYYDLQVWLGLVLMFAILKLFKYMRLTRGLTLLWRVLNLAVWSMTAFAFVMCMLAIGFGLFAMLMFGYNIRNFHNLSSTLFTLQRMAFGDLAYVSYDEMKRASAGVVAPLFVVAFLLVLILITMNMFIVILLDYYEIARDEDAQYYKDEKKLLEACKKRTPFTALSRVSYSIPELFSEFWHFIFPTWHVESMSLGGLFCYRPDDGSATHGPFRFRCASALRRSGDIGPSTMVWLMKATAVQAYDAKEPGELSFVHGQVIIVTRQRVTKHLAGLGHTLQDGHWEGYVASAPEYVGTFPAEAVKQIWRPLAECFSEMAVEGEVMAPAMQQGGTVRLCFNEIRRSLNADRDTSSTIIHNLVNFEHSLNQFVHEKAALVSETAEKITQLARDEIQFTRVEMRGVSSTPMRSASGGLQPTMGLDSPAPVDNDDTRPWSRPNPKPDKDFDEDEVIETAFEQGDASFEDGQADLSTAADDEFLRDSSRLQRPTPGLELNWTEVDAAEFKTITEVGADGTLRIVFRAPIPILRGTEEQRRAASSCPFASSVGLHFVSSKVGLPVLLGRIEPASLAGSAAAHTPQLQTGMELKAVLGNLETKMALGSGAAVSMTELAEIRPLELRLGPATSQVSMDHINQSQGVRSVRLLHSGSLVSHSLTAPGSPEIRREDLHLETDPLVGASSVFTMKHCPRVTTRLRVHPTKQSVAATILLGGGPRTLLRYLHPGEAIQLHEPSSTKKLDAVLEFVKRDEAIYPKVIDTKKFMAYQEMKEEIVTFRVRKLRSWELWKAEGGQIEATTPMRHEVSADGDISQVHDAVVTLDLQEQCASYPLAM